MDRTVRGDRVNLLLTLFATAVLTPPVLGFILWDPSGSEPYRQVVASVDKNIPLRVLLVGAILNSVLEWPWRRGYVAALTFVQVSAASLAALYLINYQLLVDGSQPQPESERMPGGVFSFLLSIGVVAWAGFRARGRQDAIRQARLLEEMEVQMEVQMKVQMEMQMKVVSDELVSRIGDLEDRHCKQLKAIHAELIDLANGERSTKSRGLRLTLARLLGREG